MCLTALLAGCTPKPYLKVTQTEIKFPYTGDSQAIPFTTNMYWDASSDVDWITVTPRTGDPANSILTLKASANKTYGDRSGTVTITVEDLVATIKVSQVQNDSLIIKQKEYSVPSTGGFVSLDLLYNTSYKFEIKDKWISQTKTKTLTSKTIDFSVEANPDQYSPREGTIVFTTDRSTQTVVIKQLQKDAIILSQDSFSLSNKGTAIQVDVNSNIDCDVVIPYESRWITVAETKSLKTDTHIFNVDANNYYSSREGYVIFKGKGVEVTDTLKIIQAQTDYFSVAEDNIIADYQEQLIELKVLTNTGYDVVIDSPASSWISVVSTKAVDTLTTQLLLARFPGSDEEMVRSGYVYFVNKTGDLRDTVFIEQSAKNVYYIKNVKGGELMSHIGSDNYEDVFKLIVKGTFYESEITAIKTNLVNLEYLDISEVSFSSSSHSIQYNMFSGATSLKKVILPDDITSFGASAFSGCTSLEYVSAPGALKTIGSGSFADCTSLESFEIPDGLTRIDSDAFKNCISLKNMTIPVGVTRIEYNTFGGCKGLKNISLSSKLNYIGNTAFANCSSLVSISIPSSVNQIGNNSFEGCKSLSGTVLLSGVTTLGTNVFKDCISLSGIRLPDTATAVPMGLLYGCTALSKISCAATEPPVIQYNAFYGIDVESCRVYVPTASVSSYRTAGGWSDFINITGAEF